jgi:hypothetical protein
VTLSGVDGKLFGATTDHKLWMRDSVAVNAPWYHIGYADGMIAMTALEGKLFATTKGNKLLVCYPAPWNIRWKTVSDAMQVVALAGLDGKLYAVTKENKLWVRDPSAVDTPWQYLGDQQPVVSLAGLGGRLFAATVDNKLWMRTPPEPTRPERAPPEGLQVIDVSIGAPDWLRSQDVASKVVATMTFNRAIKPSTLEAPAAVKIDLQGLTSGRAALGVSGTLRFSRDARTAVFISKQTLDELIRPQADEIIEYRIALAAPDLRPGISSSGVGDKLDRDGEGNFGNSLVKVIRRPHVASQQPDGRVF